MDKSKLLQTMKIGSAVSSVVYCLMMFFIGMPINSIVMLTLAFIGNLFVRSYQRSAGIFIWTLILGFAYFITTSGGYQGAPIIWIPFTASLCLFLIDGSAGPIFAACGLVIHLISLTAGTLYPHLQIFVPESARIAMVYANSVFATSLTGYFAYIYRGYSRGLILLANRKSAALEKSNFEKSKLITIIAHDIRNPLIFGSTLPGLIRRALAKHEDVLGEDFSAIHDKLQFIERGSHTIKTIVDDTLELEAVSAGVKDIKMREASLSSIFEAVISNFEGKLLEKKIRCDVKIGDGADQVYLHASTFQNSVVSNILSNAIKFTKPGGEIDISSTSLGNYVELKISDSGIGMPKELLANLFEFKSNRSRSGTNGEKGTGFGMLITKDFLRTYGAKIRVESVESVESANLAEGSGNSAEGSGSSGDVRCGTTFIMELPKSVSVRQGERIGIS